MKLLKKICIFLLLVAVEARYKEQHRPCSFNPLCTCSNGGPDLGSVCCHNIPFMTVPTQIRNSAIYIMSLKYNKLRFLEDYGLNGTGLWKLEINNNLLTDLPPNALAGLDKTLSILDLSENELIRIPKEAIQNLEKLYNLNLAGNHISFFQHDDFRSVSKTLKILDLSDNSIVHINNDAFRNMIFLEEINLAFNAMELIDDITFQSPLNNLRKINLMGNQLHQIPLNALANLKNLKIVNLNENFITSISEGREVKNRINLEEMHLENNLIEELNPESFRLFNEVDRIYLQGNPLTTINDTFLMTNVTELYMQNCQIRVITKNAFHSIIHTLKVLDLSDNQLQEFPPLTLYKLIKLSMARNEIKLITPEDMASFDATLKYLDIRGLKMKNSQDILKTLPNLRELMLNLQQSNMNVHTLFNTSPSIEKMTIVKSSIKVVENGAFQQLGGLKHLDLSHNLINRFANTTFKEIGHTLEKLILHNAVTFSQFPDKLLYYLSKLQYLDLSGNKIDNIPSDSFTMLQSLKYLNLNNNEMKKLDINLINGIHNPNLLHIKMAFNKLASLKFHSFRDLHKLIFLQLNDNLIKTIEKSSFLNLDSIIGVDLSGNLIETIDADSFQNLPSIQFINLAYNELSTLNLEAFDQVGRLSNLRIDVDHNNIQNLTCNYTSSHVSSNIKTISFSQNNISMLESNYFDPIRLSINNLNLSCNNIRNLTTAAFTDMTHLKTLDLSHNEINVINKNELQGLKHLQILDLSHNKLEELESTMFTDQQMLWILSIAHNQLEILPKDLFKNAELEQLDASFNTMLEFPEEALQHVRDTLQFLDLSGNQMQFLNFSAIKFLKNLRHFSIAHNGIHMPGTVGELQLPKLISLDLSHNYIEELPAWILDNLPNSLESLNLANSSLKLVPVLEACNILNLNLSHNDIQSLQAEALDKLKKVQIIDFSHNELTAISNNLWSNLQQLRTLYLQGNPIQSISNNSFSNMERLQELYLKGLKLQDIQKDAFQHLTALKKIEVDTYPKLKNIDLSQLLSKNHGLKEIYLHVQENEFDGILKEKIPKSLKSIIIEGENLKAMGESAFSNINAQDFTLDIRNTNISYLSQKLFQNMKEVKNFTASFKNNKLQKVERVITAFEIEGQNKNLKLLELSGNQLHCNCELAWIWEWLREYEFQNECKDIPCDDSYLQDLREVKCINMQNMSIINAFKTELDCFSSGGSSIFQASLHMMIIFLMYSVLRLTWH